MGIEPTWDFVEPHNSFEDCERHQVACHLRDGILRRLQDATDGPGCRFQTAAWPHWRRFRGGFQSESDSGRAKLPLCHDRIASNGTGKNTASLVFAEVWASRQRRPTLKIPVVPHRMARSLRHFFDLRVQLIQQKAFRDYAVIGVGQNQPRQGGNGRHPFCFIGFLRHASDRE